MPVVRAPGISPTAVPWGLASKGTPGLCTIHTCLPVTGRPGAGVWRPKMSPDPLLVIEFSRGSSTLALLSRPMAATPWQHPRCYSDPEVHPPLTRTTPPGSHESICGPCKAAFVHHAGKHRLGPSCEAGASGQGRADTVIWAEFLCDEPP